MAKQACFMRKLLSPNGLSSMSYFEAINPIMRHFSMSLPIKPLLALSLSSYTRAIRAPIPLIPIGLVDIHSLPRLSILSMMVMISNPPMMLMIQSRPSLSTSSTMP